MLRTLLVQRRIAEVTCEFGSAAEARAGIEAIAKTEAALVDIRLPDGDGIDLALELRARLPKLKIILVSSSVEQYIVHRVMESGIMGFVHKGDDADTLATAVEQVTSGGLYLSPQFVEARELYKSGGGFRLVLSPRETEVLKVIGAGFSDGEASELLGLAVTTVATHRRNIMGKLGLHTAQELQAYALTNGFVTVGGLNPPKA